MGRYRHYRLLNEACDHRRDNDSYNDQYNDLSNRHKHNRKR